MHLMKWVCILLILHCSSSLNIRSRKPLSASFQDVHPFQQQHKVETSPAVTPTSIAPSDSFSVSSVVREGLSGAFAGSVQVILLMWLRTTMSYQYKYGVSMRQAVKTLYKEDGVRRFYKGVSFAIMQAPLAKFFSVAANDITLLLSKKWNKNDSALSMMMLTAFGGIISCFFRVMLMPIDTCKTVLQVDGTAGFKRLMDKVLAGQLSTLYQGTLATIVATFVGHYPWYATHNYLQKVIATPPSFQSKVLKNALIAFIATAVSDMFSNSIRIIKTVKQTSNQLTYLGSIQNILNNDGYKGLFGRGMMTRILSNGIQSIVFTVIWKLTSRRQE